MAVSQLSRSYCRYFGLFEGLRLAELGSSPVGHWKNGCLDLARVEGLADLIDAETEGSAASGFACAGGSSWAARGWRQGLLRAAALTEATIDFADEDVHLQMLYQRFWRHC